MDPATLITGIVLWTIIVGIYLFGYTGAFDEEARYEEGRFDHALVVALHPLRHEEGAS